LPSGKGFTTETVAGRNKGDEAFAFSAFPDMSGTGIIHGSRLPNRTYTYR
jgi:hypothetical protein